MDGILYFSCIQLGTQFGTNSYPVWYEYVCMYVITHKVSLLFQKYFIKKKKKKMRVKKAKSYLSHKNKKKKRKKRKKRNSSLFRCLSVVFSNNITGSPLI